MAFQLDNSSFMQGAGLKQRQRKNLFDQLAQSINRQQWAQEMQLKKDAILADREAKANDPKALADSGMMKAALGEQPSPQEMAAMKVWQAKQRPIFDPTTGGMMGAPDIFSSLALPNAPQGNAPQGNAMPSEQEEPTGINIDQIMSPAFNMPMENRPYRDNIGAESMSQGDIEAALNRTGRMKDTTGMGNTPAGRMKTFDANLKLDSALNEYAAKKGIDLQYLNAEQRQKLMYEKELSEQKSEMMKQANMPRKIAESDNVFDDISKSINILQNSRDDLVPPAGTLARATSMISESKAGNLKSLLSTVQSATGLNKLEAMRESSPTGASGLGALNQSEMKILQDIAGEIQISTDADLLEQNLKRFYNTQMDLIHGTPEFIENKVLLGDVSAKEAAPYLFRYDYNSTIGGKQGGSNSGWSIKRVK